MYNIAFLSFPPDLKYIPGIFEILFSLSSLLYTALSVLGSEHEQWDLRQSIGNNYAPRSRVPGLQVTNNDRSVIPPSRLTVLHIQRNLGFY